MTKKSLPSNIEWENWGRQDPLMGVATRSGRGKSGTNPWTPEEFYELGRSDWNDFFDHWKRYGVDITSCLEIGCSTGRFTKQIADHFGRVFALDISQEMIDYARRYITARSVKFLVGDGMHIPLENASVTTVFSAHVFQHFDSLPHASAYFQEVARVLAPGGTMMIHLPIHRWPAMPGFFNVVYSVRKRIGDMRAKIRRILIRAGLSHHHFMRGLSYPTEYFYDFLSACGFSKIEITIFMTKKEDVLHPCLLAKKSSSAHEE